MLTPLQQLGEYLKRDPSLIAARITFLSGTPDKYLVILEVQGDDNLYRGYHPSLPLAVQQALKQYDKRD